MAPPRSSQSMLANISPMVRLWSEAGALILILTRSSISSVR